ncbi:MAG: hypothetical protein IPM66_11080 [Acidobacteriota bacterium]|nr:MAG: hypothetical protein IPM66_11080 [Acidobacteriota bacterium]
MAKKHQHHESKADSMQEKGAQRADWYELADFFVSFGYAISRSGEKELRTKVTHSQIGDQQSWDGIATSALIDWMLKQADLTRPVEDESKTAARPEPIELSDLTVTEMAPTGNNWSRSSAIHTECTLRLPASSVDLTRDQIPFRVETYLVDIETGQPALTASYPSRLKPGELVYQIKSDFPAPEAGRYQLIQSAQLLPPAGTATSLAGPIIRVLS